ncbi:hypothetical protein N9J07_06535, partial [Bacteroidia bacterium]|nr:hypothetical protein [Bacteroidia bacterium]
MRFLIIALLIGYYTVNAQVDSFPYFANHTDDISTITYSPNGKYVVSGSWDATIAVQTTDRLGTLVHREENYQGAINSIAFSGHTNEVTDMLVTLDRKFLISSSKDKTIRIWNIATGKEEHQFTDHTWAVTDIDMDAFGLYLVSGGL